MAATVSFTVESACSDWPNGRHLYRIRVPSAREDASSPDPIVIKYFVGPCPRDPARAVPDARGELLAFDTLPAGDWNLGSLTHDPAGKYILASTATADLPSVLGLRSAGPAWHKLTFDLTALLDAFYARRRALESNTAADEDDEDEDDTATDVQCAGYLSAAVLPDPTADPDSNKSVVGVWAWEPGLEHGIAAESRIYALLEAARSTAASSSSSPSSSEGGTGIPSARFLGHLTDNGTRVVGFLLERVAGAREAGPADAEACRAALGRLHALGVAYGAPLGRRSFLVCPDGRVRMQGFAAAVEAAEEEVLRREMEAVEAALEGEAGIEAGRAQRG